MYEKLVKFTWLKFEATNNQLWLSKHRNVCDAFTTAIDNYAFIAELYIDKYGQELANESYTLIKRMFE